MSDQQEALDCLGDLLLLKSGLSDFEVGFIESMSRWEGNFTPKQAKKIIEIYDENC